MNLARFSRWQAAPIHLLISAVIATLVVSSMLLLWYPQPFFTAAGGATLLILMIGVDVIIGPLLTLIVYDPRKKSLMWDLAIIATLQVAALMYGVYVMFDARPVYAVFAADRFELVSANEIAPADLDKAAYEYRSLPVTGPKIVGAKFPENANDVANLGVAALMGGSIGLFPQHYTSYDKIVRDVVAKAKPLADLKKRNAEYAAKVDEYVAASHKPEASFSYLPLQSRRTNMTMVLDASTGQVQGVIAIDPW
jgi:hypothetical protein